jgi:hypothetical protein
MSVDEHRPATPARTDTEPASRVAALEAELASARRNEKELSEQLAQLKRSLSWRITAPLRRGLVLALGLRDAARRPIRRERRVREGLRVSPTHARLVSCVCVTRNRAAMLARAINCFLAQTHPARELVIVYEDTDLKTRHFLSGIDDPRVRIIEVPAALGLSLGALRNLAIDAAKGRWFCQWDDDDWHHPLRLAVQWRQLRASGKAACTLESWLIYDAMQQRAFVSECRAWEGSLLCDRDALDADHHYPPLSRGEDTPFVERLTASGALVQINRPDLYVYVYHGANTWDATHWIAGILARSRPLGRTESLAIQRQLEDGLLAPPSLKPALHGSAPAR